MSDYRHVGQSLSNRGHWVRQAVSDVYVKPFRISSHLDEAGCRQDRVSVVQSGQFFAKKLSSPRPICVCAWLLKCCFTSTETVGLLGTGAQDVHLDFHTAHELCAWLMM